MAEWMAKVFKVLTGVAQYVEDAVCPPVLRWYSFTISAMDNKDHNPTATTGTISFHGASSSASSTQVLNIVETKEGN